MKKVRESPGMMAYLQAEKGPVFSVREAKAHFSALASRAAAGEEITITWHGRAWARLAPLRPASMIFRVDRAWLHAMPKRKRCAPAETLVRTDRDARG